MIKEIQKRDGRIVPFDISKIADAIFKSAEAVGGSDHNQAMELALQVQDVLGQRSFKDNIPTVEQIQDIVEETLIKNGKDRTAKEYILYRYMRTTVREKNTQLMKTFKDLTFKDSLDNDLKRENANIDGNTAMGTMLKYGSEASKSFSELYVLKTAHSLAHREGYIHIHDLDFIMLTETCCQIGLRKLLKDGFSTGHGFLREPNSIQTAAALTCIAIQANQNDQHGGQSIPDFEYGLAPYVAKSYIKRILEMLDILVGNTPSSSDLNTEFDIAAFKKSLMKYYEEHNTLLDADAKAFIIEQLAPIYPFPLTILSQAKKYLEKDVYQGMEALIHNLNTMHCFHPDQEVYALNLKSFKDFKQLSEIEKGALFDLINKLYVEGNLLFKEVSDELSISVKVLNKIFQYYGISKRDRKENNAAREQYLLKTRGVRNVMQLNSSKEKLVESQKSNHNGVMAFNTAKKDMTCLKRYGYVNPMKNEEVKRNCVESNKRNHGGIHNLATDEFRSMMMDKYGQQAYPSFRMMIDGQARRTKLERYIYDLLSNDFQDLEIKNNVRSLIPLNWRLELDIYFPEIKLGIEVNGSFSHSLMDYQNDCKDGTCNSHEMYKEKLFNSEGIKVLQIWEEEWYTNQEMIYNLILKEILDRRRDLNV